MRSLTTAARSCAVWRSRCDRGVRAEICRRSADGLSHMGDLDEMMECGSRLQTTSFSTAAGEFHSPAAGARGPVPSQPRFARRVTSEAVARRSAAQGARRRTAPYPGSSYPRFCTSHAAVDVATQRNVGYVKAGAALYASPFSARASEVALRCATTRRMCSYGTFPPRCSKMGFRYAVPTSFTASATTRYVVGSIHGSRRCG